MQSCLGEYALQRQMLIILSFGHTIELSEVQDQMQVGIT